MRTQLRKLATTVALTALTLAGASAVSPAASADPLIPPVPVEKLMPVVSGPGVLPCYSIFDSLGTGFEICLHNASVVSAPSGDAGGYALANGSVRACRLGICTSQPFDVKQTGTVVDPDALTPRITYVGSTNVPLTKVCVGSVCTPASVTVPLYEVSILPPGSRPATVCTNGSCTSPVTPSVAIDTGDVLSLALQG